MLQFDCPSCETHLQADVEHAGMEINCPECGTSVTIPSSATAITAEPPPSTSTAVTAEAPVGADSKRRDHEPAPSAAAKGIGIGMFLLLFFGIGGCLVLVMLAIIGALLIPSVQKVRQAAATTESLNNMKEIGLANLNYHDANKRFPQPNIRPQIFAPDAKAVDLSWRVTLLPYMEQEMLYKAFDLNAAWDHANNRNHLSARPKTYDFPVKPPVDPTQTPFQYFTGPDTMFRDATHSPRIAEVTDGLSNTLMFAEASTPVPWSKPADMVIAPNVALPLPPERNHVGMADGSVRILDRRSVNDATLRLLINPRDGQALPRGVVD